MSSIFVKYSCGCIGIPLPGSKYAIMVKPCDGDLEENVCFLYRDMDNKDFIRISEKEQDELIRTIGQYVHLGHLMERQSRDILYAGKAIQPTSDWAERNLGRIFPTHKEPVNVQPGDEEWMLRKADQEDGQPTSVAGSPPKE